MGTESNDDAGSDARRVGPTAWRDFGDPVSLLDGLFTHSPVPYAIFTSEGICALTNAAYRAMFGRAPPPEYRLFDDAMVEALGFLPLLERALAGEMVRSPTFAYDPTTLANIDATGARSVTIACTFFPLFGAPNRVTHLAIAYQDVSAEQAARDEVARERDLLRAIVDQSGEAILVADERGTLRIFNRAAEIQHGAAAGEIGAPEWTSRYGLRDLDGSPLSLERMPLYRALHGEVVRDARWRVRRPDGEMRTLAGTATPLRKADGTSAGAVLVAHDLTDLERAAQDREQLLAHAVAEQTRLEAVLEQMAAGVYMVEAPSGRIIFANEKASEILGHAAPAFTDTTQYDQLGAIHEDGRPYRADEYPLARVLRDGNAILDEEIRYRRPDGRVRVVRFNAAPVRDHDGKMTAGIMSFVDTTARNLAESRLRFLSEASELLASSLDFEATLTALTKLAVPRLADACVVYLQRRAGEPVRPLAIAHADPLHTEVLRELHERWPLREDAERGWPAVIRTGKPELVATVDPEAFRALSGGDAEATRRRERIRPRSYMTVPLTTASGTIGAITLASHQSGSAREFNDTDLEFAMELARRGAVAIENARLFEAANEAIRLREEFLSIASHELKTPLTPIQLQVAAIRRRLGVLIPDERAREWLATRITSVERQVKRLDRLIDELLDVSRIVNGRLRLERAEVDLVATVRELVQALEQQGTTTNRIRLHVEGSVLGNWDKLRVEQIAANLISNALKYGLDRPINVYLRTEGDHGVVEVEDHGIGIAPESQSRVFERFERAVSARRYGGLGLGLFITQQLVSAHAGTIVVRSTEGVGSRFTVRLPLRASSDVSHDAR